MFRQYLLSPPIIDDPEQQQIAIILHHIVIWTAVITLGALTFFALIPEKGGKALLVSGVFLLAILICYAALRTWHVQTTAKLLVFLLWASLTGASIFEFGVLSFEIEYLVGPISVAFLTIGRRWGVYTTIVCILTTAIVGRLNLIGILNAPVETTFPIQVFEATAHRLIILTVIGIYFYIGKRAMDRINAQLRGREHNTRQMLDLMADATLLHTMDGVILDINQRATFLLGYQLHELVGQNITLLTPGLTTQMVLSATGEMRLDEPTYAQFKAVTKTGEELIIQRRSVKMMINQQPVVFSILRNIMEDLALKTELESNRAELASVTEFLQLVTDNVPAYITYVDHNETLVFLNQRFSEVGIDVKAAIGKPLRDTLAPSAYSYLKPHLDRTFAGKTVHYDLPWRTIDGKAIMVNSTHIPHVVNGEIVGYFALGRDVSDERELLEALKNSQQQARDLAERLRLIADNLPVHIAYIDSDWRIQFTNRRYKHLIHNGSTRFGMHIKEISSDNIYPQIEPQLAKALAGEETFFEIVWASRQNGEERTVEVTYVPHLTENEVVGVFALSREVTQERKRENARRESQRLESLGLLAGGIAHDFNNLLVAILGQASIAKAKMEAHHPALRHIDKSVKAAERASSLTNQMLAYSGRGHFEVRSLNFNLLISQNLHLFEEAAIGKNITLITNFQQGLPEVEADTTQMQQVIMNLIINAAQAIGDKYGKIALRTRTYHVDEQEADTWQFTGEPLPSGLYVSVEVEDNGCGIDKTKISKIFEPFYSTKERGSGLGLSAVLGIIRGHNGGIRVYSEPGSGTTFRLLFPVGGVETVADPQTSEPSTPGETAQKWAKVLVIDDEIYVSEAVSDILEMFGFSCIIAEGGKQGLALYNAHQNEIGLVLLDLMMPEMNGEEVFRELRAINPSINVILTSGYSESEATRRFVGNDLAGFIQKPYAPQKLITEVRKLLQLYQQQQSHPA